MKENHYIGKYLNEISGYNSPKNKTGYFLMRYPVFYDY